MNKWITKPKEKIYCEKCDKLVEYDIKEEKSIYNIRGQEIAINAYFVFCKECGEKLLEPYYEDLNLKKAYKKYINLNNYITAQEIKNIRKIYGVNQVIFAKLLGLGEATIQRYERNSIPTKVNSDLIKRVQDPEEFKKFLDLNKNSISDSDYEKINKKLQKII